MEIGLKLLAIDVWVPAIEVKIVTSLRVPLNQLIWEGMPNLSQQGGANVLEAG